MNEQILEFLDEAGVPQGLKAVAQAMGATPAKVQAALDRLIESGDVVLTKKGRYTPASAAGLQRARVTFQRNGTPLAHPEDGGAAMPVEGSGALRAMPDDVVLVRPDGARCQLHSIIKRGRETFAAYVRIERRRPKGAPRGEERGSATAVPCDPRIPYDVALTGDLSGVKNDDIALLKIERWPEYDRPIQASVVRALGGGSSMRTLMRAVAEDHGFATERAPEAEAEAAALPDAAGPEGREDLRALLVFTIDGADAKDFDDAVSIAHTDAGWRLGVHIADVSHYVRPGTAVDADALARGTSLYLPGLTVPMLPERLCNDLCSLMPDVDRLAMSLFMDIRDGAVVDHRLTKSVIHSKARLTYRDVNRLWAAGESDISEDIRQALNDMRELSRALRARRDAAGAIDFELEEPEFVLGEDGVPEEILCAPRGEAEMMIEDFMLAANATVAALAKDTELPFIYRVHEPPDADRLKAFELTLTSLGVRAHVGQNPHPGRLRTILEASADSPARDIIRQNLLRALKRAQYSEKPLGHYALAMPDYCHFTSPIRRYPDLVVHRMLKRLLDGQATPSEKRVAEWASESSAREYAATLAERQADDIMMAAWMSTQIGRKFTGTVSGVTAWGMYVTLPNRVEGLVRLSDLDDYYVLDAPRGRLVGEATGTVFRLGDAVRVRARSVSVPAGEIDFQIVSE